MVPADSDDVTADYQTLVNELRRYNPELLDKRRILAVTKCDMLDDELTAAVKKTLPKDVPCVMISSVARTGIEQLKDLLWKAIND